MAISASSVSKDRVYREDDLKALFEAGINFVDSTISFNQGDLMCYDTGSNLIRKVAATTDGVTFLGIAPVKIVSGVLAGPYTGLSDLTSVAQPQAFLGPIYGVTANMILKTGDAFLDGVKVYLANGENCQTVSVTDPGDGNYIGLYVGDSIASAAAGQEGQIKLGCRYPSATGTGLNF